MQTLDIVDLCAYSVVKASYYLVDFLLRYNYVRDDWC